MFSLIKRESSYLAFMLNMCRSNLTSSSYVEKVSTCSRKPFCFFDIFGHFFICILNIYRWNIQPVSDLACRNFLWTSHAKFLQFNDVLRVFFVFYVCFKSLHKVSVGFRCKLWPGRNSLLIFKAFYLDLGIWAKRSTSDSGSLSGRCPHLIFK